MLLSQQDHFHLETVSKLESNIFKETIDECYRYDVTIIVRIIHFDMLSH